MSQIKTSIFWFIFCSDSWLMRANRHQSCNNSQRQQNRLLQINFLQKIKRNKIVNWIKNNFVWFLYARFFLTPERIWCNMLHIGLKAFYSHKYVCIDIQNLSPDIFLHYKPASRRDPWRKIEFVQTNLISFICQFFQIFKK